MLGFRLLIACAALLLTPMLAIPVWAQMDIAGRWNRVNAEDTRALGGEGSHVGDYTGIPLSEAGRIRAETWDPTVLSERERQAQPHNTQYFQVRTPSNIERVTNPITGALIAYQACCEFGGTKRIIWMDGRPHPPDYAERTWQGFSTGKWNGNILTVTTTHLRTGFLYRNGTPASLKSTVVEHFIRHGDHLTVVQFVNDPAYLEMPLIRTHEFVRNPVASQGANPPTRFEIIDEVPDWEPGYVPSYALGAKHTDWAEYVGLPYEASRGGKETLFPEYVPLLDRMIRDMQAASNAQRQPAEKGK
jgi:hypothetical protein